MRTFRLQWSWAFSLVCEVALRACIIGLAGFKFECGGDSLKYHKSSTKSNHFHFTFWHVSCSYSLRRTSIPTWKVYSNTNEDEVENPPHMTLLRSITMFCGHDNIMRYNSSFSLNVRNILHNIVMPTKHGYGSQ